MEQQQKAVPTTPVAAAAPLPPLDPKGAARRRFARAGAGATGVILTLHSQPGMAALSCSSPSGFASMTPNASAKPQNSCDYNLSHGYWKMHPEVWQGKAGIDPSAKFGKIFRCTGSYARLVNATLMQVIEPSEAVQAVDRGNVAMQTVAAYLNARASRYAGVASVLPEDLVIKIWNEFVTKGYYTPVKGGTPWNGAMIASYFESTFR